MKRFFLAALAAAALLSVSAESRNLKIIETTDVHGSYLPYDFITLQPRGGSLARVSSMVDSLRSALCPEQVLLADNGDFLQGQPIAYYYNYIDTVSPHVASEMLNYMRYDASTIGNHDVETGHAVYDRWVSQNDFPVLAANVINTATGEPYLPPYTVINRGGMRIAILGMLTPAIPGWLPENLWSGLSFDDMVESATRWVPIIKEKEQPDLMIGMFHSGRDSTKTTGNVVENASLLVAQHVPGFDIVLMGHDHSPYVKTITNDAGERVLVINPANNAMKVADIDVAYDVDANGKVTIEGINGKLTSVEGFEPDAAFTAEFAEQAEAVKEFVSRVIGHIDTPLTTRDAYFGSSAFVDFIHSMQLALSGAEVSMVAPLSFDATIPAGDIKVSDMFNLYKYENTLYTMRLTGQEIKDYLEMSYDIWTHTVDPANADNAHLLRLRESANPNDMTHTGFQYPSYNFDSAAGIIYTVDVTKPRGQKINIISMADGSEFDLNRDYTVAINSYRGNGGGNLLTEGAGIAIDDLPGRIITATDRDLRYYLIDYIQRTGELHPQPLQQWRFIPEQLVAPLAKRDRALLWPDEGK